MSVHERLIIPESCYNAGALGEDLSKSERERYIGICLEEFERIPVWTALAQMRAYIHLQFGEQSYSRELNSRKRRILQETVDTRNGPHFLYDPTQKQNYLLMERTLGWQVIVFGNVAVEPLRGSEEAFLVETEERVLSLAPGMAINKVVIHAPIRENGEPPLVGRSGYYRMQMDSGEYRLGFFGKSPGVCMADIAVRAITDGQKLVLNYSLLASLMEANSKQLKYYSRKPIRDWRHLMGEFNRSMRGEGGFLSWMDEKIKHTFWIGPDADIFMDRMKKQDNTLRIE